AELRETALCYAVGLVPSGEIDRTNILAATRRAMCDALARLCPGADFALIDALQLRELALPQQAIIRGDACCASIAAASVIAKTHRDALMRDYHREFPQYGFESHVGYGAPAHLAALRAHGPCPIHRLSFRGVLPDSAAVQTHEAETPDETRPEQTARAADESAGGRAG
ncbi:MAG: ribonuclease HII, partial [Acidobacteria bacterium]|nr:ribonuclease HII [Acidobacteriota bacterium]